MHLLILCSIFFFLKCLRLGNNSCESIFYCYFFFEKKEQICAPVWYKYIQITSNQGNKRLEEQDKSKVLKDRLVDGHPLKVDSREVVDETSFLLEK